jgi:quinolinate synthase
MTQLTTLNDLIDKIQTLKKSRNAVILAHNYQIPEVQDIADFVGDSLGLSIEASKTTADVIVFCGVHFMAETAAILSPSKIVILPEPKAGCPMADMINVGQLKELKAKHPQAKVVCYVNSGAEIKAESNICCTSANAIKVVKSLQNTDEILFVPDKYLGHYVSTQVKDKQFVLWNGYCPTHVAILPQHIETAKKNHPAAKILVHPECRPETIALADAVLSTGGMLKMAKNSEDTEFIIATEVGILYSLQKNNPDKKFWPANEKAICPNMKLTNLEKILWSLEGLNNAVVVPITIADPARSAIEKMLRIIG